MTNPDRAEQTWFAYTYFREVAIASLKQSDDDLAFKDGVEHAYGDLWNALGGSTGDKAIRAWAQWNAYRVRQSAELFEEMNRPRGQRGQVYATAAKLNEGFTSVLSVGRDAEKKEYWAGLFWCCVCCRMLQVERATAGLPDAEHATAKDDVSRWIAALAPRAGQPERPPAQLPARAWLPWVLALLPALVFAVLMLVHWPKP